MIFDLINPSDACLMISDDFEAAAVAICLLGEGKYSLEQLDANPLATPLEVPMFLFGGHEEWFKKTFGHDFETSAKIYRDDKLKALTDALDSVVYGKLGDLKAYDDAMELITQVEGRNEFKRRWNDRKRGSMNNIGKRAHALAQALRGDDKKPVPS
jgi:hypothetical protein